MTAVEFSQIVSFAVGAMAAMAFIFGLMVMK